MDQEKEELSSPARNYLKEGQKQRPIRKSLKNFLKCRMDSAGKAI
jgi:hypothetical protein